MKNSSVNYKLVDTLEDLLKINIVTVEEPPQGMDSQVLLITDNHKKEYAVKYGKNVLADKKAIELLKRNSIDVKVPEIIKTFILANKHGIVFEKINDPLLETISVENMHKYIPSMITNLKKIHKVTSNRAGFITDEESNYNWKEFLLSFFTNQSYLDWDEISIRDGLDEELVKRSVAFIIEKITRHNFMNNYYSLLHTDFNQRNLFIDPDSNEITCIIDWAESMFGDPLYDFARIRMFIWHFNLGDTVTKEFEELLNLDSIQKELLELYWLIRIIEYLAYYSEDLNEFNTKRISLHQEYLRNYLNLNK